MIRPAGVEDVDAVVALERDCLLQDAWSPALIEEGLAGRLPTVSYLVATAEGGAVVGHAVVSVAGDIAELQRIAVSGDHRRQGLASQLFTSVVDVARRGGSDRLLLEVRADNRDALAFYAARGLIEIDRRPRYYSDGTEAVVMRLPLVKGCG